MVAAGRGGPGGGRMATAVGVCAIGRGTARRRRGRGQFAVLDVGVAVLLAAATLGAWAGFSTYQRGVSDAVAAGDRMSAVSRAATTYVSRHYTAFEQYFTDAGATVGILDALASCPGTQAQFACAMPSSRGNASDTSLWGTLAGEGLLPPEASGSNAYGQTYHVLTRCSAPAAPSPAAPCTAVDAILVAVGGAATRDSLTSSIVAQVGGAASYVPVNAAIATGPWDASHGWLTANANWRVGGTPMVAPGHAAVSLTYEAGRRVAAGAVQRRSGAYDARASALASTLYLEGSHLGRDAANNQIVTPAGICFCPSGGYYQADCRVEGTVNAGVDAYPLDANSPNSCGVPNP